MDARSSFILRSLRRDQSSLIFPILSFSLSCPYKVRTALELADPTVEVVVFVQHIITLLFELVEARRHRSSRDALPLCHQSAAYTHLKLVTVTNMTQSTPNVNANAALLYEYGVGKLE